MNEIEQYEFDRLGYLVIPGLLTAAQVKSLSAAVDALEDEAAPRANRPPHKKSPSSGGVYHHNAEKGYLPGAPESRAIR